MSAPTAEVVICGAGIAGIAAAYHLAVRRGVPGVVLVDEGPPLSLTSDKSTECYRNGRHHRSDALASVLSAPGERHPGRAARSALRLVQRPAARHVPARARP